MSAGASATPNPRAQRSPVLGGYAFDVVYLTDVTDPTTVDDWPAGPTTVTLTGFEQDFNLRGIWCEAYTGVGVGGSITPANVYACVNMDSIVKYTDTANGHDPTIATFDVFCTSPGTQLLRLWVY